MILEVSCRRDAGAPTNDDSLHGNFLLEAERLPLHTKVRNRA
jgi:hypothetical protein